MNEMTRLKIDDYVINDHHVNANYGLGHFAEHGAYVKDEYLDLIEDGETYKKWYIKRKKIMDGCIGGAIGDLSLGSGS